MSDRYANFANSGPGRAVVRRLGLPTPPPLRRYRPGDPLVDGPVLLGGAPGGRLGDAVRAVLAEAGVDVEQAATPGATEAVAVAEAGAAEPGPPAGGVATTLRTGAGTRFAAIVFDATGSTDAAKLRSLHDVFHPYARSLLPCARVIVLGTPPTACATPREATAQRALEGFVRSVGKEFGRGTTAQLCYVTPGDDAAARIASTLRFLLSARSAYVSGQVITVGAATGPTPADRAAPLADRVALVTGAARGIGAEIARVLARDGAHVVGLDVPAAGDALAEVTNEIGGTAVQLDLTAAAAPKRLAAHLAERHGRVDIVVHNAGITKDRTLARMRRERWDAVLDVNLIAPERVTEVLLEAGLIPEGGRIIGVASIAGIAGNRGQTNYATSKAGVIGLTQALAPVLAGRGITVNAVAPGFIETAMTAKMPVMLREAGRRMNSLAQGGLPVDVAETIAWLASPGSAAVTGNVVRVCGQSLLGA